MQHRAYRRQCGIGDDHLDRVDPEAHAGRERDQVVDRHHLMHMGVRGARRHHGGAGALARGYQMVLAQQPQCLADGVAADRKPRRQFLFGRKLGPDRMDASDDLVLQGVHDLEI